MRRLILFLLFFTILGCQTTRQFHPLLKGDCVDRAIKIRQELRSKGYNAQIILGVIDNNGKLLGHAWIEYYDFNGNLITIHNY